MKNKEKTINMDFKYGLWKGEPLEKLTKGKLLIAFLEMANHYEERLRLIEESIETTERMEREVRKHYEKETKTPTDERKL